MDNFSPDLSNSWFIFHSIIIDISGFRIIVLPTVEINPHKIIEISTPKKRTPP